MKPAAMSPPESPTSESSGRPTKLTPKKTRYESYFNSPTNTNGPFGCRISTIADILLADVPCLLLLLLPLVLIIEVGVFVSIVSTKIPFKGTSKEYIGEDIEPMAEAVTML